MKTIEFLRKKGLVAEDKSDMVITVSNGAQFNLSDLLTEYSQLTKREQFAMAAMQGLIHLGTGVEKAAELAIKHADALLTKLNEKP
jgi:hypothetical protein